MKADLHVHSQHSDDGHQTVQEILERCKALGIGAVAITDHNAFEAPDEAGELEGFDIIVIPAMEITTEKGHVLAVGIKDAVPRGLGVKETIEKIHEAGGIAIAPHPFRRWSGLGKKNIMGNGFDAIEVVNGRSNKGSNGKAHKLAEKLALPGVAGSDAHNMKSIGKTYTEVPDDCRSYEDIIQAIKDKKCEAFGPSRSASRGFGSGLKSFSHWLKRGFRRV